MEIISEEIFIKGQNLRPFSGLALSKIVGYVYMEKSFDTIINMGYGWGISPIAEGG